MIAMDSAKAAVRDFSSGMLFTLSEGVVCWAGERIDNTLEQKSDRLEVVAGAALSGALFSADLCAGYTGAVWVSVLLLVSVFVGGADSGVVGAGL